MGLHRLEITPALSRASTTLTPVDHQCSHLDSNLQRGRQPLRDGEHNAFRGWGTQGQLLFRDMSLSDDEILKKGTQLWSNSWGHVPN